jgi:hypothetical protein
VPLSRRRKRLKTSVLDERIILPSETTARCGRYVFAIQRSLRRRCAGLDDREDRAAALILCAFSDIAHMEDPREREDFVRGIWNAYCEFVPATIAANDGAPVPLELLPNGHKT